MWRGSVCDNIIWHLKPRRQKKGKGSKNASWGKLSLCFWQRITRPGSNNSNRLSVPLLTLRVDKEYFPGQSHKHCAFIFDMICNYNNEGYRSTVSVYECLCAWLSHCFSVAVCGGVYMSNASGPVSLLSRCPESKKQAGTEGLSHITLPFNIKAQGLETNLYI